MSAPRRRRVDFSNLTLAIALTGAHHLGAGRMAGLFWRHRPSFYWLPAGSGEASWRCACRNWKWTPVEGPSRRWYVTYWEHVLADIPRNLRSD